MSKNAKCAHTTFLLFGTDFWQWGFRFSFSTIHMRSLIKSVWTIVLRLEIQIKSTYMDKLCSRKIDHPDKNKHNWIDCWNTRRGCCHKVVPHKDRYHQSLNKKICMKYEFTFFLRERERERESVAFIVIIIATVFFFHYLFILLF